MTRGREERDMLTVEKLSFDSLTREDFRRIVEIEKNCGLSDPYPPELIMEILDVMDNFVCRADGEIVGFLMASPKTWYLGGSAYIVNINVAVPHRGKGIAKRLILAACRYYLPLYPDRYMSLDVTKTSRARALYAAIGFQETAIPSRNGEGDLVMAAPMKRLEENLIRLIRK